MKKGLNPKTVLAIYCQQNNLDFPVYSVGEENENDPEWRIFKARFELGGKSVMGSARTKKAAETNAARKFLNNLCNQVHKQLSIRGSHVSFFFSKIKHQPIPSYELTGNHSILFPT